MKRDTLPALTGLRGPLALFVVWGHFGGAASASLTKYCAPLGMLVAHLSIWSSMPVNCFFLLSGFVLAYTYLSEGDGFRGTVRAFYVARIARIYPAYALGLVLALVAAIAWDAYGTSFGAQLLALDPLGTLVRQFALMQLWLPPFVGPLNPPSWSLSCEALFYLLFPFAGTLLLRVPARGLPPVALLCWLASTAPSWCLTPAHRPLHWTMLLDGHPLLRFPEFLLGVVAGRLYVLQRQGAWVLPGAGALALGALGAMYVALLLVPPLPRPLSTTGPFDPLLILLLYALAWGRGLLARLLSAPPLLLLGEASYATYILHWPLWLIAAQTLGRLIPASSPAFFPLYVAGLLGASVATLRLLENPARAYLRYALDRRLAGSAG